jgi:hypothetical protein
MSSNPRPLPTHLHSRVLRRRWFVKAVENAATNLPALSYSRVIRFVARRVLLPPLLALESFMLHLHQFRK